MQSRSAAFDTALAAVVVEPVYRLIMKVENNRFASGVTASNVEPGHDETVFPIESIAEPTRPNSGTPYAIADQAIAYGPGESTIFRAAGEDMPYTVWLADNTSTGSAPYGVVNVEPTITYDSSMLANVLTFRFDITQGTPTVDATVYRAGSPTVVASGLTPDSDGVIELYWNGTAWVTDSTALDYDAADDITGVAADVTNMSGATMRPYVISVESWLHRDVTDRLEDWSIERDLEAQNDMLPYSTVSSGRADFTLQNDDDYFTFFQIMDKNVRFDFEVGVVTTSGPELLPQGTFYSDGWSADLSSHAVSVNCYDAMMFAQERRGAETFVSNQLESDIARDIFERAGFGVVETHVATGDDTVIPYYYSDSTQSTFEHANRLVTPLHSTMYMDEQGRVHYYSKQELVATHAADLDITGDDITGGGLEFTIEANDIEVEYSVVKPSTKIVPAGLAELNEGTGDIERFVSKEVPVTQFLWRPDGNIVLGSAPLAGDVLIGGSLVPLGSLDDLSLFPDEGIVAIDSEYIRYDSKSESPIGLNISERGALNSSEGAHYASTIANWETDYYAASAVTLNALITQEDGGLLLNSNSTPNTRDTWYTANSIGISATDQYKIYGTDMKFTTDQPSDAPHLMGGMFVNRQPDGRSGYYFELVAYEYTSREDVDFAIGNIRVYKMDGSLNRSGVPDNPEARAGYYFPILQGFNYKLEITHNPVSSEYQLFVNGQFVTTFTDTDYPSGEWGIYVRGNTDALFDYVYAHDPDDIPDLSRWQSSGLTRRGGGSNYSEFNRHGFQFFEEFAPPVREVREFEVNFDVVPAVNAQVFNANEWESMILKQSFGAFGGKFIIENISRNTAVLEGDDADIIQGETQRMALGVYGQAMISESKGPAKATNQNSIRRRGRTEATVSSELIQSDEFAQEVADYIRDVWSNPTDFWGLDWFPHVALQPGDIVTVTYPEKNLNGEEFFVRGVSLSGSAESFSGGLRLRKVTDGVTFGVGVEP